MAILATVLIYSQGAVGKGPYFYKGFQNFYKGFQILILKFIFFGFSDFK
jgi:hypothetical protein